MLGTLGWRHLQRKQEGQHSPSTTDGLAQVTGGQEIWWQTVLNFYKTRKAFMEHSF